MQEPSIISQQMTDPIDRILYSTKQIQERVKELGEQITRDYAGKDLLVVCVLKGSLYFTADLIRHIDIPLSLDFMAVSSYGTATSTSGIARITKDLDDEIEGRHILIAEDILDTGLTLDYLVKLLKLRNPADIKICALLDKKCKRITGVKADYSGFEIPNLFVVGYGLDYQHKYRHLPFICVFREDYVPED